MYFCRATPPVPAPWTGAFQCSVMPFDCSADLRRPVTAAGTLMVRTAMTLDSLVAPLLVTACTDTSVSAAPDGRPRLGGSPPPPPSSNDVPPLRVFTEIMTPRMVYDTT